MIESIINFYLITAPFFLMIAVGFFAVKCKLVPVDSVGGMNLYVLYGALPCLLFDFVIKNPIDSVVNIEIIQVYGFSALFIYFSVFFFNKIFDKGTGAAAFLGLISIFPNTGLMGVALISAILGKEAVPIVVLLLCFDMVISTSVCLMLSRYESDGNVFLRIKSVGKVVFLNPLAISIVLGILFTYSNIAMPDFLMKTISLQGEAAPTLALFVLGAVMARAMLKKEFFLESNFFSEILSSAMILAIVKIILHPMLIIAFLFFLKTYNFNISNETCSALILASALPCASNVPIVAERNGIDSNLLALTVVVSTLFASITFPLWATFLAHSFIA